MASDPLGVALLVASVFDRLTLRYAIGGAVASTILGEPRATRDLDLVAAISVRQLPGLIDAFETAGFYVPHDAALEAVRQRRSFNIVHRESAVKVDLFVAGRTPLDEEELARRRLVSVGEDAGERLYVAAPEDLIAQKLRWYRDGGETSDRQWRDVLGLIKVQRERLDRDVLARAADRLDVEDLLRRALMESGAGESPTSTTHDPRPTM